MVFFFPTDARRNVFESINNESSGRGHKVNISNLWDIDGSIKWGILMTPRF